MLQKHSAYEEEWLPSAKSWAPSPVTQSSDDRLDQQSGHRTGKVQDGDFMRLCPKHVVDRVDCTLLKAESCTECQKNRHSY
jgi:hypothetical protein